MKIIEDAELLNTYLASRPYTDYFRGSVKAYTLLTEYVTGEYILKQDAPPSCLYLMISGRCSISILLANGKSVILQTLKAPCLIGEMELIRPVSSFTVQSLEQCRLLAIPLDQCKYFLLNDPYFLRAVCFDLIGKERTESLKLIHAFGYPLENRLAHFILENCQGNRFYIKKVHIAESLGVSYRHVEKVISDFVRKQYLSKEKLIYTITDRSALMTLSRELEMNSILIEQYANRL